jgi:hypothetical protein
MGFEAVLAYTLVIVSGDDPGNAGAGMALDAGQELWPPEETGKGTSKSHGNPVLGGGTRKVKCLICEPFYQTGVKLSTTFVAAGAPHRFAR